MILLNNKSTSIQPDWFLPVSIDCDRNFDKQSLKSKRIAPRVNSARNAFLIFRLVKVCFVRYDIVPCVAKLVICAHTFIPKLFPSSGLSVQMRPSQHHLHY